MMNDVARRLVGALCALLLMGGWARGGELLTGVGYGKQVGHDLLPQNNASVDVIYDFYEISRERWCISLGLGAAWLWNDFDNEDVAILSMIPTLRYFFCECEHFKPYAFVRTGFAYLTEPELGQQELGGYFAFNDYFGVGAYVGRERNWSLNLCWQHISNAGLFDPNDGIDIPYCFMVGRRL